MENGTRSDVWGCLGVLGGFGGLGFWGFGVLGFWGFGVLGFWGFGVLGFWGFGVLGFWGFGVLGVFGVLGFWGFGVLGFCNVNLDTAECRTENFHWRNLAALPSTLLATRAGNSRNECN